MHGALVARIGIVTTGKNFFPVDTSTSRFIITERWLLPPSGPTEFDQGNEFMIHRILARSEEG